MAQRDDFGANPFAAPDTDLTPEKGFESRSGLVYATFGQRFAAAFIDGIVMWIVSMMIGFAGGIAMAAATQDDGARSLIMVLIQILAQVVNWMYYALQESSESGATLGKKAMGLRVVDLSGEQVSFGRATGRYFGKIISAIILLVGYLMQPFTERKQALHDIMAGTLVIKN